MKEDVIHTDGPFAGITKGQVFKIIYKGEAVAMIQVTRVKEHALGGVNGTTPCKVTKVSDTDLRYYEKTGHNRELVLRGVVLQVDELK